MDKPSIDEITTFSLLDSGEWSPFGLSVSSFTLSMMHRTLYCNTLYNLAYTRTLRIIHETVYSMYFTEHSFKLPRTLNTLRYTPCTKHMLLLCRERSLRKQEIKSRSDTLPREYPSPNVLIGPSHHQRSCTTPLSWVARLSGWRRGS